MRWIRTLDDCVACHGQAFGGIVLAFGRVGAVIVFVAFRLADTDSHRQMIERANESFKVGRVLSCGIDAQMDVRFGVTPVHLFELRLEFAIAFPRLGDRQRRGRQFFVFAEKADMMPIAGSINTDAQMPQRVGLATWCGVSATRLVVSLLAGGVVAANNAHHS